LHNVVLAGRFPPSAMPELFQQASGLLVSLKADEIFSFTVPSKVQAYLAAGKPIIASVDGEGARVVLEAGAGLACPAEDAKALADRIRTLYQLPKETRERMGTSGRDYFMKHYEMENQAKRLLEILEQRMGSNSSSE
jgi:glycosyltransferase involved in cell wall biosynthesis